MYNLNTKDSIYKYRENNKEKWDEQMRKNARSYYARNKEEIKRKNLQRYYRNKEDIKKL